MSAASVVEEAIGAIEGQRVAEALLTREMSPEGAWHALVDLARRQGWSGDGPRAFFVEVAKRARRQEAL